MGARTNYFVRPVNGDDAGGDGLTHATAWKTTQYALNNITRNTSNGDAVNLCDEGTDTTTATLSLSTYASTASRAAPLMIQGYTATPQDGGIGVLDGNSAHSIFTATSFEALNLFDLTLQNPGSNACVSFYRWGNIINCEFIGGTKGAAETGSAYGYNILHCKFDGQTTYCIQPGTASKIMFNWCEPAGTGGGIWRDAGVDVMFNTVWHKGTGGFGINVNPFNTICAYNSIYKTGTPGGVGVESDFPHLASCFGNLIEGWTTGIKADATDFFGFVRNNGIFNCTTAIDLNGEADLWLSPIPIADFDNETLTASPFVDAVNGDFTPTLVAQGIAGWPTKLVNTGADTRLYKGAIQPGGAPIGGSHNRAGGRAA